MELVSLLESDELEDELSALESVSDADLPLELDLVSVLSFSAGALGRP